MGNEPVLVRVTEPLLRKMELKQGTGDVSDDEAAAVLRDVSHSWLLVFLRGGCLEPYRVFVPVWSRMRLWRPVNLRDHRRPAYTIDGHALMSCKTFSSSHHHVIGLSPSVPYLSSPAARMPRPPLLSLSSLCSYMKPLFGGKKRRVALQAAEDGERMRVCACLPMFLPCSPLLRTESRGYEMSALHSELHPEGRHPEEDRPVGSPLGTSITSYIVSATC